MNRSPCQIEVDGLWKVFGNKPDRALNSRYSSHSRDDIQSKLGLVVALRSVTLRVAEGEIFVVMGLSGSGKSTLVRCLTRLIEPTHGQIRFDGENILEYTSEELTAFRRSKVAMVFQHYGLLPHRRVLDNVAYGLEIQGSDKASRYEAAKGAIDIVGLQGWEDYLPREMSGGMQQRVGLARALAVDPDILVMDEPFSGLDPLIRREMQDQLIRLESSLGKTIVFITHDLNEALKLGDRIAIMRDGEIVQQGTPEEIVTTPADEYVTRFVQDVSKAKVLLASSIMNRACTTIEEHQDAHTAMQVMDSDNTDLVFILGEDRVLRGLITRDAAAELARQGADVADGIDPESAVAAREDSYLTEVIPLAAKTEHPIAVVDESGRLLGEIRQGELLARISEAGAMDEASDRGGEARSGKRA